ncbi:MAG: hypothetical protein GXP08_08200 [Gammaproteobacteria bacterium]|nr:hypothetical protein [Gammaproteobacteria bacterium]
MKNSNRNWFKIFYLTLLFGVFLSACTDDATSTNRDKEPSIQISDVHVTEGNAGLVETTLAVTLSKASDKPVSVEYASADGSATNLLDYQAVNGHLSFVAGETVKMLAVNVIADTEPEADENFTIVFSNPQNATIETVAATVTIDNDDGAAMLALIQVSSISVDEGDSSNTNASFNVSLAVASTNTVTVDFATTDLTATALNDYRHQSGTLEFLPGETNKTINVVVVADSIAELDETFKLTLSNPVNASLASNTAIATIVNDDTDTSVLLSNPGPQVYEEEQDYTLNITARPGARIFVKGMPPGMLWNEVERRFDFRPDFIQGEQSWQVTMEAVDGLEKATEVFVVTVNDTIKPRPPEVVLTEKIYQATKLTVIQTTDGFLDSPGYKGREFTAHLVIPDTASEENPLPVRIGLHGSGGSPGTVGNGSRFGVAPHDPVDTWWTGYSDQLPLPDGESIRSGTVPNYTQRRVMHLFSYLAKHYKGIDLERVSVSGQSMGGTGSYFLALRYARHFSFIFSRIGGTTPHYLSDGQQRDLGRRHWGLADLGLSSDLGTNIWQLYDASRGILNDYDFRNLHFSTVVGQNDNTIHFRHMVAPSPVTGVSFLDALQNKAVGHYIVWDQRGHSGSEGPPLNANWWTPLDDASALVRNRAFPAFTNGSADDDPGLPDGQDGYTGTLRGAINRYLRWDSANIVDTREQLSMPVKVDVDTSGIPPNPGYPPTENHYYGPLPITTDVTMRRIQNFQLLPGEAVRWRYKDASGIVSANADGSVTVPNLEMASTYTVLTLTRQ